MTQKSVNIPDTFRNKDFWLRAVSVMLSLTLMVLCVPSYNSSTASGENQNGNPNVLTNSSVTFRDSKFKNIASVESGESFYLMATIAGNHVNENKEEKYRIEITDNNLALLNFKDNGFTDGAKYNGYTLHLERNNNGEITRRYIDFEITGGETKVVRLQAKFLNGKTKAEGKTIKLIQTSTNKSVTGSVDVKATTDWKSSKTEDKSQIKVADITNGTVINYTLNASPVNPNAKKGALWVDGLKFTDTLTLHDGLKFKGTAKSVEAAITDMLPSQYRNSAEVKVSSDENGEKGKLTKAIITITVDSQNENAEMPSTTINIPFKLKDVVEVDPDKNFTGGTISNELAVNGRLYGETDKYEESIGGNAVSLDVTAPKPADFTISKTVNNQEAYYVKGNTVTFTISATNVGEQAGDITLTDVVPAGMTLESITGGTVSGNKGTVEFTNVQPNTTVSATVTCKVSTDENTTLKNEVTAGKKSAYADITVKKKITISKDGYVGDTPGNKEYIIGENENNDVTYTITVKNNDNTKAETFSFTDNVPKDVDVKEVTISDNKSGITVSEDKKTISATEENCTIGAGETITVTITGKLNTNETSVKNELENTSTGEKPSVTFTGRERQANFEITKNAFSDEACEIPITSYVAGTEKFIYYKITVTNKGDADATNVTLTEVPDGANIEEVKQGDTVIEKNEDGTYTISSVSKDNGSVVLIVKAKILADKTGNITNTAKITYNKETTEGKNIINQDISANAKVEKWVVSYNEKPANEKTAFELGTKAPVTYRVKFTNTSGTTMQNLYFFDKSNSVLFTENGDNGGDAIKIRIVGLSEDYTNQDYPLDKEITATYLDGNKWAGIDLSMLGIKLNNGQYIELEYTGYTLDNASGSNINRPQQYENPPATDTNKTEKVGTSFKPELTGEGYYNTVKFSTDGITYPYQDLVRNKIKQPDFSVSKSAPTPSSIDTSNVENWRTAPYEYSITLTSKNNNNKYNGKTITITDELPDGMEYIEGQEIKVKQWNNDTSMTVKGEPSSDGKTVTFSFVLDNDFANGQEFVIKYKTKLKDSAISAIEKLSSGKVFEQKNTVTKVTVTGENFETVEKTPNSTATITFTKKVPAPGFAKLAYASFAGQTFNNETELNYVNNGYITAGDTLIWNLVLYNGDGSDKYKADTTADIDLSKITLTDYIPNGYEYNNGTGYTAKAGIISIATGSSDKGDYRQPVYDKDDATKVIGQKYKNNLNIDIPQESIQYDASTRKLEIDLSKISGLSKLAPNQCLVIEFVTTATKEREGVVTNNGEATFKNDNIKITNESIVAGERKDDKTIFNSANYNIVGLTTESWKTITYTNQGHTGTPHTDPATDTGESRIPTHNYVQGMQGEEVTYTLHVKNNSPLSLENFVLIDRLPYVNDIGLVSGYSRNSAFSVAYKSIESVEVAGKEVGYEITYSTDKTAVLNEYSKDWVGQNDKMTWTTDQTNAVDFRIRITDGTVVKANDEVVITFKGTVPSFVENTGEENIAWNSFAYAYQNKEILGSTVMVAEPAKVGVWVEKPQTENKITINKTIKNDENLNDTTFYFALFGDNTGNKRISDVISLTVPAGQTEASVTMENLDYTSIKKAIKANGSTQADKIYLLETNAKGEKIDNSKSAYSVKYGENEQTEPYEINTEIAENTVKVTNEKQTKPITVTKTLTVPTTDKDTFYFAVFTKKTIDDKTVFVRYEEAGIKSLTMPNKEENGNKLEFYVPDIKGVTYYVFETNENGVLVDEISVGTNGNYEQKEYTGSQNGEKYTVTGAGSPNDKDEVNIINNKVTNYSITVSKSLSSDKINTAPTFYVGLYKNETDTTTDKVKAISAGEEVTFEYLDSTTTYYVFECDENGNKYTKGSFKQEVYENKPTSTTEPTVEHEFTIKYENNTGLTFDKATSHNVSITNIDGDKNKIIVTKTLDVSGEVEVEPTGTFSFGLFTYEKESDADGKEKYEYKQVGEPQTITIGSTNSDNTITFENLDISKNYYVFELDGKNRLDNGSVVTMDGKSFIVNYNGSNSVKLDGIVEGSVNITNTYQQTVPITFAKYDVLGNRMKGATFTLKSEKEALQGLQGLDVKNATVEGKKIIWTTDGTNDVTITGLPVGKYTLTETPMPGFQTIKSLTFNIGKNGYIETSTDTTEDSYTVSANSVTVVNKSEISVSKKDFAEKDKEDAKEIKGALITIERTDGNKLIGDVKLSRGNTPLTETQLTKGQKEAFEKKDGKFDNDETNSKYAKIETKIGFYSDGQPTIITGLPDGNYTMTEVVAPNGYGEIKTALTFKIENGKVQRTDSNDTTTNPDYDKYDVSGATTEKGNTITMFDTQYVTVSKKDIANKKVAGYGNEVPGALITIERTDNDGKSIGEITLSRADTTFEAATIFDGKGEFTNNDKNSAWAKTDTKIGFYSGNNPTIIKGLPNGNYTMTEVVKPNGFEKLETTFEFTIANGVARRTSSADENYELDNNVITMFDTATRVSRAISIEKRAGNKDDGEILEGALFKITAISSGIDFSGVTLARKNGTDDAEFKKATIKSDKLFLKDETTGTETEITSETPKYTTYYGISTDKKTLLFYSDGTTILNNLADGTYELEELAAPEGYIKGDGIITITVKDGEITVNADNTSLYGYEESSYTLTVVNSAKSNDFFISKRDATGEKELAGALITITRTDGDLRNSNTSLMRYQGDNSNYMTHNYNFSGQSEDDIKEDFPYNEDNKDSYVLTTDKKTIGFYSDGNYPTEIMYLPNGTYTLKELLAPDNYETLTTTFKFTLENGKVTVVANNDTDHYKFADTTITMLNQLAPEKASISIRKESSIVGTGGQREILTGALFRLTANSPDSIDLSNVTLARKNGTDAVTFIKATVNEAKDKLLVDNTEITSETESYTNYYGISEDNKSILFYSDNTTAINDLPNGVYILEELVAPEYYDRVDYQIQITIKNGKIVKATDNKGNSVFGEGETGSGSDYVFDNNENSDSGVVLTNNIQVRNTPKNIFISKKVVGGTNELEGALITITRTNEDESPAWRDGVTSLKRNSNDMTGTVIADDVIDENTSITKGQYVVTANSKTIGFYSDGNYATEIKNLLSGTYELKEVVAPDGYRILTTTFKFTVSDDGKITTVENEDTDHYNLTETTITMSDDIKSTTISKVDENGNNLPQARFQLIGENESMYEVAIDNYEREVQVTEPDSEENPLLTAGKYGIYQISDESNTDNGKVIIEWITNNKDFVIKKLPAGTYTLREVSAPTGYNPASDITFKIDENGYITDSNYSGDNFTVTNDKITVANTEIPKVSVSKKAIGGTDELPGALITITAKERSTEKPFGNVTLSRGNTTLTPFVPASSEDIIEEINDTTFAYTGNEQKYIVTDNGLMLGFWSGDTETIITQLPDGVYEMREVVAPDTYNRVETVFQFTISDGVITASSVMSESGEAIQDSSDFSSSQKAITMFDTPKDKTVTIKKTDITGDEEIGGATLELTPKTEQTEDIFKDVTFSSNFTSNSTTELSEGEYKKEANKITWVSLPAFSDNNALTITGIKEGTYILKETIAPDGYTIATEIEFTVNSDGTITIGKESITDRIITVEDDISRIKISKKEINGTSELPGAELKLTKTGNFTTEQISKVKEATDNAAITFESNGITWTSGERPITLNQLPDGDYTLTEITAPNGYEKAENINFTIENGKIIPKGTDIEETSVTMRDEKKSVTPPTPVKQTVTISKQDITNNSELKGAKLTITKGSTAGGTIVKQWTSGDTPKKFELEAGTYMLTEVTAPDGYLKAESIIFFLNALGGIQVAGKYVDNGTVVMKDAPMTVYISKQDITNSEELAGAKLEITQIDENGNKVTDGFTKSWTSTDEKTLIEKIPTGTYELTEITAPEGYEVTENIVFTVNKDGKITIDGNEVTDKTVVMKDAPMTVYISKQDITNSEELAGAKLEITQIDENGNKVTDGFTKSWTSTDEKTLIEKIPTGTYELTEITAPEGYEVAEKIVFTVNKDGKITIDGNEVTDKTIVMKDAPTKVYISKQDITGSEELAGAKLEITQIDENGNKVTDGFTKSWTSTDEKTLIEKIPTGTYELTEITAPEGYEVAEKIVFTVNKDGKITIDGNEVTDKTVVMKDAPMTVYISKQDITNSEELAGAKLEITQIDENGNKVTDGFTKSWTSTDEKTLIEKIPTGTYELTEITAPEGYEVAEKIVFTVDKDGKITIDGNEVTDKTIVMKDAPTKVYISKQDITGSEELAGAKLEITQIDENGNKVTDGFTKSWASTDEKTLIEKIPTGTYELTEITAPEGYEVAEKIVFTVDKYGKITIDGKEVTDKTVVMYDKPVETTTTSETTATTTETIVTVTTVPTTETTVTTAPTTTTETTTHTTITIPTTETTTTTVTTSPTTETTTTTPTETTRATTATTVPTTETTVTTAPTTTTETTTHTTITIPTTETTTTTVTTSPTTVSDTTTSQTTTPTETTKVTTTTVPTTETTVTTAPTTTSLTTISQTTTTTKETTTSATTETTTETTTTVPTTETTITTAPTTTTETTTHTTITIPTTETTTTTETTSPTTVSDTTTSQTTTPTETTVTTVPTTETTTTTVTTSPTTVSSTTTSQTTTPTETTVTTVPTTETTVTTAPTTTTETTTHTTVTIPTTETTTTTVTTSPTTVSDTTTSQTTTPTETTITTVPTTETTVTTVSTTDTEPTTHTTVTVPTTETTTTTETTSPTTVSGTTTSQTTTPTETTITTVPTTETTVTTVSTTDTEPTTHTTVTIPTTETTETTETTSDTEYTMTMPTTSMTEDSTESTVTTTDTQVCDTTSEGATTPSDTSFTESVTTTEVTGNTSDTTETTSYTTITTETTIVTTIPSDTETSTTTSPDMTMTTTESSMTNTSDTTETTVSTADSSDTTTVTTIPEDTTTEFTTPSDMTMTTTGTSMTNNSETTETTDETSETTETTDETSETTEMSSTTVSTDTTETSRTTRTTTYTTRSTTSTTRTTKSTTSTTKHSTTNSPKTGDNFLASISALITLAGISVVLTGRRKK